MNVTLGLQTKIPSGLILVPVLPLPRVSQTDSGVTPGGRARPGPPTSLSWGPRYHEGPFLVGILSLLLFVVDRVTVSCLDVVSCLVRQ